MFSNNNSLVRKVGFDRIDIDNKVFLREMRDNRFELLILNELLDRFLSELEIDVRIETKKLFKKMDKILFIESKSFVDEALD